jgi:hypothetical protein
MCFFANPIYFELFFQLLSGYTEMNSKVGVLAMPADSKSGMQAQPKTNF